MDRIMSPTGSTPNLANTNFTLPPHWNSSVHLPHHSGGGGGGDSKMGYNTIGGHGHWGSSPYAHSPYPSASASSHVPSQSMSQLPTTSGGQYGSYNSHQADRPTLGYIVAYNTDQIAELMKDQFNAQAAAIGATSGGHYNMQGVWSPNTSPKRPLSVAGMHSVGVSKIFPHT